MKPELREALRLLFELFEMQDGEWPSTHVFHSAYGKVWGTLPDDVTELLQAIYLLVEEGDAENE